MRLEAGRAQLAEKEAESALALADMPVEELEAQIAERDAAPPLQEQESPLRKAVNLFPRSMDEYVLWMEEFALGLRFPGSIDLHPSRTTNRRFEALAILSATYEAIVLQRTTLNV